MSTPRRHLQAALVLATGLAPAALAGQAVSGRVLVAFPKSSLRVAGTTERVDGLWAGAGVGFHIASWTFSASGTRGTLSPTATSGVLEREVGEISAGGRYEAGPSLAVDGRYVARVFSSAAGRRRWSMAAIGVIGSRDLGTPAVRASASLAYLQVLSGSEQAPPKFGLGGDMSISVAPAQFPLALSMGYRVEQFQFRQSARRSEQFEALTFSVGVRVRRLNGRWALGGRVE
jgi:hypothetical protein